MNTQATSVQPFDCSSYRLGLIDPATLVPVTIEPCDDGVFLDLPSFSLLVPGPSLVLPSLLADLDFQRGATFGYWSGDLDAELEEYGVASPAKVANWVAFTFFDDLLREASCAWTVGYLLGSLTCLAETDQTLALVGIAHLCYVLALVPALSLSVPFGVLHDAQFAHDQVIRAYREQVRVLRAQGMDFVPASRAALAGPFALHPSVPPVDHGQFPHTLDAQQQALAGERSTLGAYLLGASWEVA